MLFNQFWKPLVAASLAAVALFGAGAAQARGVNWSVGVSTPYGVQVGVNNGYGYGGPVYGQPVVVAPPVYYNPPPVYYAPAPVYYAPAPVYRAAPPVVVIRGGYGGGYGWRHGYDRGYDRGYYRR